RRITSWAARIPRSNAGITESSNPTIEGNRGSAAARRASRFCRSSSLTVRSRYPNARSSPMVAGWTAGTLDTEGQPTRRPRKWATGPRNRLVREGGFGAVGFVTPAYGMREAVRRRIRPGARARPADDGPPGGRSRPRGGALPRGPRAHPRLSPHALDQRDGTGDPGGGP